MYYETQQGDDELKLLCCSHQVSLDEENELSNDDIELKVKKTRKRRRNEASILEQENEIDQLSNIRPKRAAAIRVNDMSSNQRKIDEFISKKNRSPKKNIKSFKINSILPSLPINDSEQCPICDRLISNDILEIHTNACLIHHSDASKELIEKSKQRAKNEAKIKEVLFQRTTRKNIATHLIRTNSETTTCPTCGMQMTVFRLENQHKNECLNRFT
ncbi:unnamed protein product [Rotaria sordida]|uniref:UBZ4-type domain-containing protein n=1 Tax=Rotaria sordida TaxID=392033 RepID=A0A814TRQ3_9BILA|nr:unnamed protein product [Rotaria sordida]CAF1161696.1 unnamed protein product [Rotaria sordida]CAF3627600.1 unnamed protein product [Rotaria sordida]